MERKAVRKMTSILAFSLICLTLMSVPSVSAKPKKILRCEVYIELNWDWVGFGGSSPYTWIGTVSGDINGKIYISLMEGSFSGKTEHFSETWLIETSNGKIEGFDEGVWSMSNYKWIANGRVTGADGIYSDLVGANFQYKGTTTEFPVPKGTPVSGTGKLHITPRP